MADSADQRKAYVAGVFDRAAACYEQTGVRFFEPAGAALVAAAGLRPGDQVLDVGCGRGASLFPAADQVGPEGAVTGIDLAPGMVAAVRAEIERLGIRHATVRIGDAEAPEFADGSFDAVLAGFVIFFLPDPLAAVRAYARLLRPGGRLALSTYCEPTEQEDAAVRKLAAALSPYLPPPNPAPADQPPPEQRLRTRGSIGELLDAAGFTDLRYVESGYRIEFGSPAQYWEWMWSGGFRGRMEQLAADRLDDARTAFTEAVEEFRAEDGSITVSTGVRFTTARRPG
jgi:ubiquinone/menaquinone biosynthesis C-methylase UbiE